MKQFVTALIATTPPGQVIGDGDNSNSGGNSGNTGRDKEKFQYFYHPDHLGSSSYITDATGEVYQHLEYFAFGEMRRMSIREHR